MTTLEEKIAVMQHFANGGAVEIKCRNEWELTLNPMWDWCMYDYRIKPNAKRRVEMYQWLCKVFNDEFYISNHFSRKPDLAIRRLDETKIIVEVDDDSD